MNIRFYNTLNHRMEDFETLKPRKVYMYNCGPTVYDYSHIGNFRSFIFADVLRRFLELAGYEVHQVMNLTDVGHMTEDQLADGGGQDKMELASERIKEAKKAGRVPDDAVADPNDPYQIAKYFIDAFLEDATSLGLKIADEYPDHMPRATEYIPQMQAMIQKLLDNGHAYVGPDGVVYYSVQSFPDYGRLSGNTIDKLRGGAGGRVNQRDQAAKRHPADFLLWKPDGNHIMKWDSPWGVGYPNWHIECSVMATSLHGRDTIDIHTGGEDNIFPHHECEIAQTCGATGSDLFARFWMHSRYLMVEGEKMSKSKGNFHTLRDVLNGRVTGRRVDPAVVRYELLKSHYRSNMNFTRKGLQGSASAVRQLRDAMSDFSSRSSGQTAQVDLSHPVLRAFTEALADDLNMGKALGVVFTWLKNVEDDPSVNMSVIDKINSVLNVFDSDSVYGTLSANVYSTLTVTATVQYPPNKLDSLCRQIDQARADKDYDTADRLRQQLIDAGYEIRTTKDGTTAHPKLA